MIIVLIRIKSLYFLIQTTFIDDNDDKINERKNSFEHKSINHKEKRLFLFLARTKQNKNKKEREIKNNLNHQSFETDLIRFICVNLIDLFII